MTQIEHTVPPIPPPSAPARTGFSARPQRTLIGYLAPILCLVAVLVAYANTPGNDFQLDDWHVIQENPAVRSLDNIPRFFTDATTASVLAPNIDYRPIVQVSYAIDYAQCKYAITDAKQDAWHRTNMAIHIVVCWCIFLVGRRLFGTLGLAPIQGLTGRLADAACLAAALLFAVHPITSGPVNYISSRSSSLAAMFVLLALLWYLRGLARPARWWRFAISGVLFVLGMLSKVEAVSFLAAIVLAELLLNPQVRRLSLVDRFVQWNMYARLGGFLIAGIALVLLWRSMTGLANSSTRAGVGVTSTDYLLTQFRAWWYYIGQVFAPIDLITDYPTYPLTKANAFWSTRGAVVLLALAGWAIVLALAVLTIRRAPVVTFLIVCFFAYLAPHSSIVPLAEPVNEHRPYLPDTAVFLLLAIGAALLLAKLTMRPRLATLIIGALLAVPLTALTRERNTVWRDAFTLWGDNVRKTPDSSRVQMNYGLELMKRGQYKDAEGRFREAIRLSPGYHYAYSNLAITLARLGDNAGAMAAHNDAVSVGSNADLPYYWRGKFKAEMNDVAGALADFEKAISLGSAPFRELAAAAECLNRLGRSGEAQKYIDRGRSMDKSPGYADFEAQRVTARAMFGAGLPRHTPADINALMSEGSALMAKNDLVNAEVKFRDLVAVDDKNIVAHVNIGLILAARGYPQVARQWLDKAVQLAPESEMPYYWRARFFVGQKDWPKALLDFRTSENITSNPVRNIAAIAETLMAAGQTAEAETEAAKVPAAQAAALNDARAEFKARALNPAPPPSPSGR